MSKLLLAASAALVIMVSGAILASPRQAVAHEDRAGNFIMLAHEGGHEAEEGETGGHEEEPMTGHHHEEEAEAPFLGHLINWLGQFHVMIVHFPIALILAAGLAEIMGLMFKKDFYFDAARFIVIIAALSAIPTVLLGAAAEHGGHFTGPYVEIIEHHEDMGVTTMIITIVAAALSELWRWKQDARLKILYRLALCAAMVAVAVTGHFGGELVHGVGYWKW